MHIAVYLKSGNSPISSRKRQGILHQYRISFPESEEHQFKVTFHRIQDSGLLQNQSSARQFMVMTVTKSVESLKPHFPLGKVFKKGFVEWHGCIQGHIIHPDQQAFTPILVTKLPEGFLVVLPHPVSIQDQCLP